MAIDKNIKNNENSVLYLPLGGAGEIGMNLYLYGSIIDSCNNGCQWIMVDCGVKFASEREPGVDIIIPDISFVTDKNLIGIFITHAHEDHLGALPYLYEKFLDIPIYMTKFSLEVFKNKLDAPDIIKKLNIHLVDIKKQINLGDFTVNYFPVPHSIPEANALIIKTKFATIFHSGDWRYDEKPKLGSALNKERISQIGDSGCTALVCDSTNIFSEGISSSEAELSISLRKVIANIKGLTVVTTFSSNIARILIIIEAAIHNNRKVMICGSSIHNYLSAAQRAGVLNDLPSFLSEDDFEAVDRDKLLVICSGSQGERMAPLARISEDNHPVIKLHKGDSVIFSSKTIPGNEINVAYIQNNLVKLGVEVITDKFNFVHLSGHPFKGELKLLYDLLQPELIVPMHGEYIHLAEHADFASECGYNSIIINNGQILNCSTKKKIYDFDIKTDLHYLDGKVITASSSGYTKQRRKLSFSGFIIISISINKKTGLIGSLIIEHLGISQLGCNGEDLNEFIEYVIDNNYFNISAIDSANDLGNRIALSVRIAVKEHWGIKPICKVLIHKI